MAAYVEDVESQLKYGIQEQVLSLPSAYSESDAYRWGKNQIERYKEPTKSAKVTGVKLEYPKPDGSFFVTKTFYRRSGCDHGYSWGAVHVSDI